MRKRNPVLNRTDAEISNIHCLISYYPHIRRVPSQLTLQSDNRVSFNAITPSPLASCLSNYQQTPLISTQKCSSPAKLLCSLLTNTLIRVPQKLIKGKVSLPINIGLLNHRLVIFADFSGRNIVAWEIVDGASADDLVWAHYPAGLEVDGLAAWIAAYGR